jgi:hypothetical protein
MTSLFAEAPRGRTRASTKRTASRRARSEEQRITDLTEEEEEESGEDSSTHTASPSGTAKLCYKTVVY